MKLWKVLRGGASEGGGDKDGVSDGQGSAGSQHKIPQTRQLETAARRVQVLVRVRWHRYVRIRIFRRDNGKLWLVVFVFYVSFWFKQNTVFWDIFYLKATCFESYLHMQHKNFCTKSSNFLFLSTTNSNNIWSPWKNNNILKLLK